MPDSKLKVSADREAQLRAGKEIEKTFTDVNKRIFESSRQMFKRALGTDLARDIKQQTQKGGMIHHVLWGDAGEQGFKASLRSSSSAIGRTIFQGLTAQFGQFGKIAGGAPGAMSRFGAVGGLGMVAAQAGTALAGRAVGAGRSEEALALRLAPIMGRGGSPMGRGGVRGMFARGRGARFGMEETAAMAAPLGRMGAGAGLGAVMRAQRGFGTGGDLSQLLGAQVARGGRMTGGGARQEQIKIIAAGMKSGLEQGRWGEIAKGMAQMTLNRGIGVSADSTRIVSGLETIATAFRGMEGFQALQGMERMAQGGRTPLGRAVALQSAGLGGRLGGDIFAAERQMELGLFGTTTRIKSKGGKSEAFAEGGGPRQFEGMLESFRQMFGLGGQDVGMKLGDKGDELRRGALIKEMSLNMGLTQNATEKLINAVEMGVTEEATLKEIIESGKPIEEQAYRAMIGMAKFKGIETKFESALIKVFEWMEPKVDDILRILGELLGAVEGVASVFVSRRKEDKKTAEKVQKAEIVAAENPLASRNIIAQRLGELKKVEEEGGGTREERQARRRQIAVGEFFMRKGFLPETGQAGMEDIKRAGLMSGEGKLPYNVRKSLTEHKGGTLGIGGEAGVTAADLRSITALIQNADITKLEQFLAQNPQEIHVVLKTPEGEVIGEGETSAGGSPLSATVPRLGRNF